MNLQNLYLKKGHDRRIRFGHPWVFSNEIDTTRSPLKSFPPGSEVIVYTHDDTPLGVAYINPHSLIAARIFSYDTNDRLDTPFFTKRLTTALSLRSRLFAEPYYRLIFGEADSLPGLIADRFNEHLVLQLNTAGMENKQDCLLAAIDQVLPTIQSILLRNDSSIRKQENLESYIKPLKGAPPETVQIIENSTRFIAPLWQGQKTGWFYDHRLNRARLKNYVAGKSVLDVFSYLGGWGLTAAVDASLVTCIDSSALATQYIQQNAALNKVENKLRILNDDAFDALKELLKSGNTYDVIILDPPAFVKKAKDLKEGMIAYQRLNEMALKLLTPDGILISCSCSMQVSEDEFIAMIKRAAYRALCTVQLLERGHQGPDHPIHLAIPESNYLKALILRKM